MLRPGMGRLKEMTDRIIKAFAAHTTNAAALLFITIVVALTLVASAPSSSAGELDEVKMAIRTRDYARAATLLKAYGSQWRQRGPVPVRRTLPLRTRHTPQTKKRRLFG